MKTSGYPGVRASSLAVSASHLDVTLEDGRMLRIPTALFPSLRDASPEKLANWEWIGEGIGIEWPDLDEFLSIAGFLRNTPYFAAHSINRSSRMPRKPRPAARNSVRREKVKIV